MVTQVRVSPCPTLSFTAFVHVYLTNLLVPQSRQQQEKDYADCCFPKSSDLSTQVSSLPLPENE